MIKLIGIAGVKNSGKDTVASMLSYIYTVGVASAKFSEWQERKDIVNKSKTIHFADPLKDVLSMIFDIPRQYFNDRLHKDETYYCSDTRKFCTYADCCRLGYVFIDNKVMTVNGIDYLLDKNNRYAVKLRELMQFFGTDIGREMLGKNIWINAAKIRIENILKFTNYMCLVPDVRFENEAKTIQELGGRVVYIERTTDTNDTHESEDIDFACNYIIINNNTLMALFYKVLIFYRDVIINEMK